MWGDTPCTKDQPLQHTNVGWHASRTCWELKNWWMLYLSSGWAMASDQSICTITGSLEDVKTSLSFWPRLCSQYSIFESCTFTPSPGIRITLVLRAECDTYCDFAPDLGPRKMCSILTLQQWLPRPKAGSRTEGTRKRIIQNTELEYRDLLEIYASSQANSPAGWEQ